MSIVLFYYDIHTITSMLFFVFSTHCQMAHDGASFHRTILSSMWPSSTQLELCAALARKDRGHGEWLSSPTSFSIYKP